MSDVRACPSCNRPNGRRYTQCMYCGVELPPITSEDIPAAPRSDVDVVAEADKARRLLAELSPEAKALMPDAVLRKLEAQVAVGERITGPQPAITDQDLEGGRRRGGPVTAEIAVPDLPEQRAKAPSSIYDVPEPSPEGDPSIPDVSGVHVAPFEIESIAIGDLEPYESMRMAKAELLAEFEDTLEGPAPEDPEEIYRRAMTTGAGPFGKREAAARLILLPDSSYRGQVHWLRHRLVSALGMDLYMAGQVLQRDIPVFLGSADSFEEAEELAEHLRDGGLRVLTIDRDGWLDDTLPEPIASASTDGDLIRFVRTDGERFACFRTDLTWAALGEIEPDRESLPLMPERGFRGRAEPPPRPSLDVEGGAFLVLDLMRRSSRRPLRFRSDEFDFGCLGDGRGLAASLNLRRLLGWVAPDPDEPIPLDERFKRVAHVPGLPESGEGRHVTRREVEFTEYVLLLDAPNHAGT